MFKIRAFRHAGKMWLEARLSKHLRDQINQVAVAVHQLVNNGFELDLLEEELQRLLRTVDQEDGRLCIPMRGEMSRGEVQAELFSDETPLLNTPEEHSAD